jgi:hypothetical protein
MTTEYLGAQRILRSAHEDSGADHELPCPCGCGRVVRQPPTATSATMTRDEIIASVLRVDRSASKSRAELIADDMLRSHGNREAHTAWDDMPKTGGFSAGRD